MVKYNDLESMIKDGIIGKDRAQPNCVTLMQQEFVEYVVGERLTHAYPVLDIFSNPRGGMQGGFISAAFDNTFGAMVVLLINHLEIVTVDLNVNFHKPIYLNDKLIVTAYIKSQGNTRIHLIGDAYDGNKNLIATATANFYILKNGAKKKG
jgi:acyl-coenzyme A thioesterase PaaI-like protein